MKFTLEIKLGNEAIQTCSDVADSLRDVANLLETGHDAPLHMTDADRIYDTNGNGVGKWQVIA